MNNTLQKDKKHNIIFTALCFAAMFGVNALLWHNFKYVQDMTFFIIGAAITMATSIIFGAITIAQALKGGSDSIMFWMCIGFTIINIIWAIGFLSHA